ncbi:amidohydrolase family protein [Mycolicibacterium senegalense]|uniref:amidohydrolase family protein n=1 Tax=Mycolicibacterium TaxID=1866885 RepID=UPI0032049FEE
MTPSQHTPPSVIDIHTHIYPKVYLDHLAARTELPYVSREGAIDSLYIFPGESGRVLDETYWSVEAKLRFMDRIGITQSVVSLANPWLAPFSSDEGSALAREVNEMLAGLAEQTGARIVGMGCVPEGDIASAAKAVREIAATPGLYGVVTGTKICRRRFDDPVLDPFWQALSDTNTPLLVHPHDGLGLAEMDGFGHMLPLALGFPYETTVALARLAAGGVLDRFPTLRVIGSHGGGAIPYLAGRLDGCWQPDSAAQQRRDSPPSTALRSLYLDALVYQPRALRAAADLVGTDRMMFGTDHPFAIFDTDGTALIRKTFDDKESRAVLAETARKLFDLPAPVTSSLGPAVAAS